jgi:hypothetical protein
MNDLIIEKPEGGYVRDRSPPVVKARRDMAEIYRQMRADNPAMARLLFCRMRSAQRVLTDAIFASSNGSLGLLDLIDE